MKRVHLSTGIAIVATLSLAVNFALGGDAYFGSGQAVGPKDLDSDAAQKLVESAIDQAVDQFHEQAGANTRPRMLLFLENIRKERAVRKGLEAAGDIPIVGVDMASYAPLGEKQFPHHRQTRSITVLAVGGDVQLQTAIVEGVEMPIKDWEFKQQTNPDGSKWTEQQVDQARQKSRQRHQAWGRQLAEQFVIPRDKTNLFLQLGTQHTPRMTWITEGIDAVFPESVHYLGVAASDFGAVWSDRRTKKPHALLGVMISGDFQLATTGSPDKIDDESLDQQTTWPAKIDQAIEQIGGKPDAALIVGCAAWHNDLPNKCDLTQQRLAGVPLLGSFGGGEIGHYQTGGPVVSRPGQLFVMVIRNR
jgi:hypothetical protein